MLRDYFTTEEVAAELGIDVGTAGDLLDGKGEWQTEDIDRLICGLAKKLSSALETRNTNIHENGIQ
ncbi:MAG: hypothetical protein FWB91_08235 [Defluviitaleaceae bacterium]|nr:hypothetical protein [Defluviitaleaceae bacterium]